MTILGRRARGVGEVGSRIGSYVIVGVVALLVGMAAAYGLQQIGVTQGAITTHQAVTERNAAVTANLAGLWESGLAQQQAIKAADGFGAAWTMRGREMASHVEGLTAAGLAGEGAGFSSVWSLRGEEMSRHFDDLINSGRAQQNAMKGG